MVAVVSGAGLGLFGSSVSALGGAGASGSAGLGRGTDRAFVNTATGNLVVQSQDDVLAALGLDLTLTRTYNSQGLLDDDNADNWRLGVHQRVFGLTGTLNAVNSTIKKTFGDGREVLYTYDASRSAYVSTEGDGAHDTLSWNTGTTQWTWTDGSARNSEAYNSSGQLLQSRDGDLNTVTYTYTSGLLTQITDQSGQTTFLDYTPSTTNLEKVRVVSNGQTQTLTRYTYDGSNRLSQVTIDLSPADNVVADGQVYTTTYTYESTSRRIATITQTDGSSVAFTYQLIDGQYRVKTYTDAEGRLTTLTYTLPSGGGGSTANANPAVLSTTDTQTTNTNYNLNTGVLTADASTLQNFVTKTGVGAAAGAWTYYTIEVPAGMSELYVNLDAAAGSSGDAALYVRRGAPPTTTTYDGRSDNDYTGNYLKESLFFQNPTPGTWYVGVYGVTTFSNARLRADYQSGTAQTQTLTPGQAVSNLEGANASLRTFSFNIAAGTSSLRLALSGLQDDGDLYMSYGAPVDLGFPDYASEGSTANEVINVNNPTAGTWYVVVKSWSYLSDAKLVLHTNLGSNTAPAVEAGDSQRAIGAATVNLSATASDAEGAVTYQWTQIAGPAVTLSNATVANPSFTAPSASVPTQLSFRVRVTDAQGASNTDIVHVTVDVPVLGYVVQAGSTWQSIANTLYGVNSAAAGSALQTALSNPPLVVGGRLNNLPATLTVATTTTVTVPAYYTVQSGNTWASITQTIYGTSDANAIAALQTATGNPTLTTGLHLTVPLTLTFGSGGTSTLYLQTDVLDALGLTTTYKQDSAGRLTSVLSPTMGGSRIETRYAYDSAGNVTTITQDPTGLNRITTLTYDANGNLLTSRDSAGNTVSRTYNANNQLLTETLFVVPDPDGAGAGQPSVPLTTRYAYDGENHLRFMISAQGRVTEHRYNTPGQRTATLQYTGSLYGAANFAESDLVTWSNTQDRTRLERTDYTYDFRGNLTTLSAYVSTDASGIGTGTPSLTQFVYDQRGQLLQTIEARGSATVPNPATPNLPYATTYVYDGLGRVKQATQWVSGTSAPTTITTYDDANRKTTIALANGLVTTRLFNRAGELISLSNGTASVGNSLGTTTYAYDANGRLRIVADSTDPTVIRQFYFYDESGRKAGYVDSDGTLTEYVYNKANALIKTIQYAAAVNATTLASLVDGSGNPTAVTLATVRTAASGQPTQDRITRNVYDTAARLVYSIDEIGAVTQYFYDGAGRVTDTVRYTNPVTIARTVDQLLPSDITVTAASATDRRTRFFYDSDGNLAGKLDGEGYLIEYLYDPAGYLFQQIAYATQTNASFWLAGTLTQLRPAVDNEIATTPERDIVSYSFYDGQGRRIGTLDGEGYFTETVYDTAGHVTQSNRWDRKLTYTAGVSNFGNLKAAAIANPVPTVHTTSCVYDGAGRKTQETDYQGTVTTYSYDAVGNLVSMTRAASTGEARTTNTNYDFLGRVLQELSAEGRAALDAISNPTPTQITDIWNKYGVTYEYDLAGRRISATVRPNDTQTNKTAYYYDNDGRLRFEVNVLGERKEYRYNALGQLTDELTYTNRISTTGLNGGLLNATLITTLTGSTSTQDALTTYTYTLTGQVVSKRTVRTATSAEDALTAYTYNAFGERLVQTESIDASATRPSDLTYDRRGLVTQIRWDQALLNITEARQYDAFGRLKQITDGRLNVVKRFEYDTLGREVAHTESATSDRTVTTYDAFSRVLTVRDGLNNTTSYGYNDTNRSMTLTTPEGVVVTSTFNRHGQQFTVVAAGNTTTYAYDVNGKLTSVSDSLSAGDGRALETRTYDRGGRELTRIDARGTTISYSYDAANRVLQRTEDSGGGGLALLTTYTYDGQGRITRVDEPNGRRTDTTYYRDGRIDTVAVDPTALNLRTRYTYDRTGAVVTVTEGYGSTAPSKPRITQYLYDKRGRRIEEIVDPTALGGTLNLRTQYLYDKSGNLARKIDARNNSTWYVYDADNRVTHTIDALGGVTLSTYDAEDRVIATRRYAASIPSATVAGFGNIVTTANFSISTGTLDRLSRSFFDRDGREKYTINAAGTVTERVFDANGQVTRTRVLVSPALTAAYADAAAVTTALGTAATTINANDRITWTAYDLRGRAAYSVDGLGKVTRYAYDPNGNVVSKVEFATARDTALAMDFTALNAAYGSTTPAGQDRYTRYWYDATDRLRFTLDPEGYLTEQQYNDAGRLETSLRYAGKPTVPATATIAHLVARSNGVVIPADVNVDQKTISAYDAAGRLSRVTDALSNYEEYTYDAVGNKLTYRNQKGSIWDYEYDANRRLTKEIAPLVAVATASETASAVTVAASTNVRLETVIAYDSLGNVTSRTEAANTSKSRVTRYEYDLLGRQTITRFPAVDVYSTSGDTQLGNAAAIARTETLGVVLFSEVAYDALGNAFRNLDVAGNYSFKIYDVLGRVEYEVDAERYVTQYGYDVFGNKTTIKRYEKALTAALPTNTSSVTSSALSGILIAGADRTVTTGYDRLNRITLVTQPSVSNFAPNNGSSGGTTSPGSATTQTDYNAFGDVTRTHRLISGSTYADTYFYYDRRGLKSAQVDALKFLTIYEYDETGDLKRQLEYATALGGTVNFAGYGTPTVTTPTTAPASAVGYDRETLYAYDRLNRKVRETRVGIEHATISGTTVSTATANQVTTYGYDVLGNQTRVTQVGVLVNGTATDLNSYTYYDVLGRVIATVEPARNLGDAANTIRTPLTVMRRDAYGNLVEQIEYANGANGTPTEAVLPTPFLVDATKDRATRMNVDSHGRVTHTEDAKDADRLASYNARGELVKEWQAVTNADSVVEYRTTLYKYDNLGRQLDVIEPQRYNGATTVLVTNRAKYNSFGEVIERGLVEGGASSGKQEFFHYDLAGRLWRTNSGDGVTKVYLHDLAGNVTAEIRSQGRDLTTSADAAAVGVLTSDVMRTETRYDALGHVVEQRLPTFNNTSGLEGITATFTIGQVSGPANPEAVYQRINTPIGFLYIVNPAATVAQSGGYYLSASGQYIQDTTQTISLATRVTWDAPTDASIEAKFEYRVSGSSDPNAWASVPVGILSTNRMGANVSSLVGTLYQYRVTYRRRTETTAYAEATGTFQVNGTFSGSQAISQNPPDPASEVATLNVTQTGGMLVWAAPGDATVVATFRVRPTGSSSFTDITATRIAGGNFQADARTALASAGTYDYEIVYTRNGLTIAKKAGTLTSAGNTNPRTITGASILDLTNIPPTDTVPPIAAQVSGNIGATIFSSEYSNPGPRPANTSTPSGPKPVSWIGGNEIRVNWANVGAGTITVQVDYITQGWQRWEWLAADGGVWDPQWHDPIPGTKSAAATATGATITWMTPTGVDGGGGVSQITAVRVYKNGAQILTLTNPTPSYGRALSWAPPADTNVIPRFEYAVAGSGAWVELPVLLGTTSVGVDVNGVAANLYDYRVTYRIGGRLTAQQTGTLDIRNQSTTWSLAVTPNSPPSTPAAVATLAPGPTAPAGTIGTFTSATQSRFFDNQNGVYQYYWSQPTNTVNVGYQDVGNRPVMVYLNYTTRNYSQWNAPAQAAARSLNYSSLPTGGAVSWAEPSGNKEFRGWVGGISSVQRVRVYGQDASGNYTVLLRDSAGPTPSGELRWTAPSAGTTASFEYWNGSAWVAKTSTVVGSQLNVDVSGLSGTFQYRIRHVRSGEAFASSFAAGTFTVSAGAASVASQTNTVTAALSGVTSNGMDIRWTQAPDAGASVVLEYFNGSTWVAPSLSVAGSTYSFSFNGLPASSYTYRIRYIRSGAIDPYLYASGTAVVTSGTDPARVTVTAQSGVTYAAAPIAVLINGDTISWNYTRQNAADNVKVTYWVDSVPQPTIANATAFSLSFASIVAAGGHSVTYVIEYLRPGETDSYARASGIASFAITYPTVNATITVNSQNAVYPSGTLPIATLTDLGGNYLGWTTSAVAGATVVFRYQRAAGAAWTELAEEVNGSGFKVNVQSMLSGLFNYEILYTRSGETNPYARATGTLNVTRSPTTTSSTISPNSPTAPVQVARTPTQRQTFDRWGNVLSLMDASSNTTNYRYNQYGQLIETRQPQVAYKSTINGQVAIGSTTPISRNYYDRAGRLIAIQDANGNLTRASLNAAGQVVVETHADNGAKHSTYDAFGQVVSVEDELGFETHNTYDLVGNLTSVGREVLDNGFTTPDPNDVITDTYAYDEAGRRISETNGESEITRYYYDLHDNLIRRRTHLNANTTYDYDANDRKIVEKDAINGQMTWAFDYFGRMTGHVDLGGVSYTYSYGSNKAGLLQAQTTQTGQNIAYVYDEAGHLTQINDGAVFRNVTYSYDAAGRRSREKTKINGLTYQDTFIQYDALNRMSRATDLRYDLTYSYDLQGNRTNIVSNYYDHERRLQVQDLWYAYDTMNRVTISQGVNTFNQIGTNTTQGVRLTYNAAGQRTTSETYGTLKFHHESIDDQSQPGEPHFEHDSMVSGFTLERYQYDGLGRLTKTWREAEVNTQLINASGHLQVNSWTQTEVLISDRSYDKASRETLEVSTSVENDDLIRRDRTSVYNDDGQVDVQTSRREDPGFGWQTESIVDYNYDVANVLRSYTVDVWKTGFNPGSTAQYRSTYSNLYHLGESYQDGGQNVSSVAIAGGAQVPQSGSTTRGYNVNHELVSFTDTRGADRSRYFANGVGGQPLLVVQGNIPVVAQAFSDALSRADNSQKSQHFFFANGQSVGSFGQLQDGDGKFKANFDVNYTPISDDYPSSVPVSVVAQDGDTLRTLAARVFGDQNLWYVLAEENGRTNPDESIEEGTVIQVPNEVLSLSNSSGSFKPFNIADAIGDTSPTQPAPPQPKKKGCGVLGTILMIVVAIVVTIYTAGALSGLTASYGSTFAAGTAVLGGTSGLTAGTAFAIGAAAGAAGSIASQGVGIATGVQEGFDWKGVALGAIGGAATAGVGAYAANSGVFDVLGQYGSAAAIAATGSALSQGIGVVTGLQHSFSWKEVAISAVAAPLASYAGEQTAQRTGFAFAGQMAGGMTGSLVRGAFGGKIDATSVLVDSFGNALGNSAVAAMTPRSTVAEAAGAGQLSDESSGGDEELDYVIPTAQRLPEPAQTLDPGNATAVLSGGAALSPDEQRRAQSSAQQRERLQRLDPDDLGTQIAEEIDLVDGPGLGSGYEAEREMGDKYWTTELDEDGETRRVRAKDALKFDPFADRKLANQNEENVPASRQRAYELAKERSSPRVEADVDTEIKLWDGELYKSRTDIDLFGDGDLLRLSSSTDISSSAVLTKEGLTLRGTATTASELQYAQRTFEISGVGSADVRVRSAVELGGSGELKVGTDGVGMEASISAEAVALQANAKFQTVQKELFGGLVLADASGEAALNALAIGGSAGVAAGYDDGRLKIRAKVSASILFGGKVDVSANVDVRPLIRYVSTFTTQSYQNLVRAAEIATQIGRYAYDWGH